jgi:hypothetical protein
VPDEDAGAAKECKLEEVPKDAGSPRAESDNIRPPCKICDQPSNEMRADESEEETVIAPENGPSRRRACPTSAGELTLDWRDLLKCFSLLDEAPF